MNSLRAKDAKEVKEKFLAAISLKWRLEEPGHHIGITEAKFLSGA
jgi:hypothetical protein